MTVRSLLCVFNAVPEDISAISAMLARAGLDSSAVRPLAVTATPRTLEELDDPAATDADILADMFGDFIESSCDALMQDELAGEQSTDDEEEDGTAPEDAASDELGLPRRMARVMLDTLREKGECSAGDLMANGFTLDEIVVSWDAAEGMLSATFPDNEESGGARPVAAA